ncbi:uncharacterized protein LOC112047068 isoform X2 [Bicyclus anynana]|uniref:Uncharacterized protein LOC112047068 isoform X2 n=1 Tax=Bicyclus anynana TaxID=110368 RepID=A0A6J1MVR9_BICAN|nr:uncharacterized protein LOC112047068 isoform X2 [Bicyclus anynana]
MEETNLKIDIPKVCTKLAEDYVSTITQRRAAGMEKEKWFDQWLLEELDNGRDMKTTVTIGNLFCELCKEAGILVMISLYPEDDMQVSEVLYETPDGCVGVLSACSDVDSAVDAFVAASTRTVAPYPWRLRWLLVQESAMERFTRALESRPPAERRAFALEHAGELPPGAVPVEAYRTTREALALLAARAPFAVAAFAADAAEANEVAFAARVPLVWINGHGAFGGPPLGAAAVYLSGVRRAPAGLPDRARWLALAPATRRARLCEALHKFSDYDPQYDSVLDISCDSAVAVDGRLWIATKTLVDFLVINPRQYIFHVNAAYPDPTQSDNASNKSSISESNAVMSFTQVLNYLLAGGAVLMDSWGSSDADRLKALVALLSEVGAPVAWVSETSKNYPPTYTTYTVKTISSTIGTIFAN